MSRVKCCCYKHFYEAFSLSDTGWVTCILEFGFGYNIFSNPTFISVYIQRKIVGKITIFYSNRGTGTNFHEKEDEYSKNSTYDFVTFTTQILMFTINCSNFHHENLNLSHSYCLYEKN